MSPNYSHTNESLDGIVKGMNVNETDEIIAVCGSGDQAFALLEYAKSVVAVDNDKEQIEYAKKRAKALKAGDYNGFFPCPNNVYFSPDGSYWKCFAGEVRQYFEKHNPEARLEKIRKKLGSLEIRHVTDLLDEIQEDRFSKAYLSNILGSDYFSAVSFIKKFMPLLKEGNIKTIAQMLRTDDLKFVREILTNTDKDYIARMLSYEDKQRLKPILRRIYVKKLAQMLKKPSLIYLADVFDTELSCLKCIKKVKGLTAIAEAKEECWTVNVFRRKA